MNTMNSVKKVFFFTLFVLVGFSAQAMADMGMGYGHHQGWRSPMHGWHHGGYGGPGFGYWGNLTQEDLQKLEKERFIFLESTEDLRRKMYQKGLELRSELAKENPDAKIAAELQTEISELKAEFDQERLNHFLKIKEIGPDIGRDYRGRYGMMGPGMMHHEMMGPGGYGGGYCPNCPYGGFRGGYGMRPGMMMGPERMGPGYEMGPRMMGRGWGRGMGPYMSGRDYRRSVGHQMRALEEKDAKLIVENYIKDTGNPNLELGNIKDVGNAFEVEIVTKEKSLVDRVLVDKRNGAMRSLY